MGESADNADLAHLLAEAAAGLPGAESRLAARLRPDLEALLSQRLNGPDATSLADAGALVQRHWQQMAQADAPADTGTALPPEGDDAKGTTGKKGRGSRKAKANTAAATAPTKASKSRKKTKGSKDIDNAAAAAAAGPLFLPYVQQAAAVMEGLVREQAGRAEPGGPAMATRSALQALDALAKLDPPLAQTARLRWFAGLAHEAIARLLSEDEAEVRRRWVKARAFVVAATEGASIGAP
jgi:DNA-directed RNA polymerase specialized sigma24 family protein